MILRAVCAPGLESVLAAELSDLGLGLRGEAKGLLTFEGSLLDGARACLALRCASTVRAVLLECEVSNRRGLRSALKAPELGRQLPPGAPLSVRVELNRSWLRHSGALLESLGEALPSHAIGKEGLGLQLRLEGRHLSVSVDLAGDLLHLRGWRREGGRAPLRETLACGLLGLAGWTPEVPLFDPMCGSGTVAIEAARWTLGLLPGADRSFAVEQLPGFAEHLAEFTKAREAGRVPEVLEAPGARAVSAASLQASDTHRGAVGSTRRNAKRAGVEALLQVEHATLPEVPRPKGPPGLVFCNAPYGRRVGDDRGDVISSHRALGEAMKGPLEGWRLALLTRDDHLAAATGLSMKKAASLKNGGLPVGLFLYP